MPREHMTSHRDPMFELRNVECRGGTITGEIRNLQKRVNWWRRPRVRAYEPHWGRFKRPVQNAISAVVGPFPAEDITTWFPFSLGIAQRKHDTKEVTLEIAGEGHLGRGTVVSVPACGPTKGPDFWYGGASWFRQRR